MVCRYVSVAVNCPYTGAVPPQAAASVAEELLRMGCFEVSIGDTTGMATTRGVEDVLHECTRNAPIEVFAGHFHDTYGQALPNVMAALRLGVCAACSYLCSVRVADTHHRNQDPRVQLAADH